MEVILKLEDVSFLKSMLTADDLHMKLKQHGLSGRTLLQDQKQGRSLYEAYLGQAMLAVLRDYWGLKC